jgi:predicted O-methyltransferase YrrM
MPDDLYREVPYLTVPMAQTHPDRLASVATLFGMTPAPVTACRVLEIGGGTGGNLIPMAYFLPGSRFTVVDLAQEAVSEGRRAVAELALTNLELIAMDLREIGPAMGEFDYIIAHGVYSWVPEDVRDRLLAVCRERLAQQGVAFISYNCLPGRAVPNVLREMISYHVKGIAEPRERIEQARALLRKLREAQSISRGWHPMVGEEVERMLTIDAGLFLHEDLAPVNDAFYFRDFAAQAARHQLQYLGDAEPHLMFDNGTALDELGHDVLEREQYLDFLYFRRFRQSLLCREEVRLERPVGPEHMDRFLFSSPARELEGPTDGLDPDSIPGGQPALSRMAASLRDVYPLPMTFDGLLAHFADRAVLREILFVWIRTGFAKFHVYDMAPREGVSSRSRSSRLARWETARSGVVTYQSHTVLKLDGIVRALIEMLDGTRDFDDIVTTLSLMEGAPPASEFRARLPKILRHMARTGLLES